MWLMLMIVLVVRVVAIGLVLDLGRPGSETTLPLLSLVGATSSLSHPEGHASSKSSSYPKMLPLIT